MKLSSIDIGTNTVRLLIGRVDKSGSINNSISDRAITRLGGSFDGRFLNEDSVARTIEALKNFSQIISDNDVAHVKVSATSVVRKAEDGPEFVSRVKKATGLTVEIIDGNKEADLMLKGVLSALKKSVKKAIVFDIGGGSTEFIVSEYGRVKGSKSINMGVVELTEKNLKSDPPSQKDLSLITSSVDDFLLSIKTDIIFRQPLSDRKDTLLIGTAGTITTLAAIDQRLAFYDPGKINNYVLTKESVTSLYERLTAMSFRDRVSIDSLEEGRADLIISGIIIVLRTMEYLGFDKILVSDCGLLEGLMIDLACKEGLF